MRIKQTLNTSLGFELSGIVSTYRQHRDGETTADTDDSNRQISTAIGRELAKTWRSFKGGGSYIDGHCMEFPSPVFRSVDSAFKFYNVATGLFNQYKVVPQHPRTVCGGNHLHFGIQGRQQTIRNAFRDIANRPYIAWVFLEPDDTDSGNNICNYPEFAWAVRNQPMPQPDIFDSLYPYGGEFTPRVTWNISRAITSNDELNMGYMDNKILAISANNGGRTLEFRCVQAPLNRHEFQLQLDFFIRYFNYLHSTRIPVLNKLMSKKEMRSLSYHYCHTEFVKLLRMLGLNPRRYKTLIERNLDARWWYNRVRT